MIMAIESVNHKALDKIGNGGGNERYYCCVEGKEQWSVFVLIFNEIIRYFIQFSALFHPFTIWSIRPLDLEICDSDL